LRGEPYVFKKHKKNRLPGGEPAMVLRYGIPSLQITSDTKNYKVETPIHDNIRELVIWECKEHWSAIMNVLANPKGRVGRWNLNFWRLEQFYTSL
jgi:hypothetical protein